MKTITIILSALTLTILTACSNGAEYKSNHAVTGSKTLNVIKANCDDMASKPWDRNTYINIRDTQIPMLKSTTAANAAKKYLAMSYAKVLTRDGDTLALLTADCKSKHSKLEKIITEAKKEVPDGIGVKEMIKRYEQHTQMTRFISSAQYSTQSVSSFDARYNESYESEQRAKAKKYLSDYNPACSQLQQQLNNLNFTTRRNKFAEAVVKCYLQEETWSIGNENIIKNRVSNACSDSKLKTDLYNQIDEFREQKQAEQSNNN